MRKALSTEKLKSIYGNIAKRYDFQHALITARADQKGRRILVENCVKAGDEVLDCGGQEDIAWHLPWLSMGCRSVSVLAALENA